MATELSFPLNRPTGGTDRKPSPLLYVGGDGLLVAPALERVRASDATATHAYLEARIRLQRAAVLARPAKLDAVKALAAQVEAECPGVPTGAPPHVKGEKANVSEGEITDELLTVTLGTAEHVEHSADARFVRTVRRLHWSDPKLARLLRSLAVEKAEQSAIPLPNLCSGMQFWVASGYTAVSVSTKRLLHRLRVVSSITLIESEPHEPASDFFKLTALVAHRLKPYEDHADRLLAVRALPPEGKLTDPVLRPLLEAVGKVYVAIGRLVVPVS